MNRRSPSFERLRVCEIRMARPIGRLRRVLHNQFDESPHAVASPVPRHRDTEVDTCCDATTDGLLRSMQTRSPLASAPNCLRASRAPQCTAAR